MQAAKRRRIVASNSRLNSFFAAPVPLRVTIARALLLLAAFAPGIAGAQPAGAQPEDEPAPPAAPSPDQPAAETTDAPAPDTPDAPSAPPVPAAPPDPADNEAPVPVGDEAAQQPGAPAPPSNDGTLRASAPSAPQAPDANSPTATPSAAKDRASAGGDETKLRYELENIEIRGNGKTHSRVILRYIPFRPGDVLDVNDPRIELTRYRLLGTGFFRDVQFSLRKGTRHGRVVLVVEVAERNTIVVNDIWMGLSADADRSGEPRPLTAFGGVDFAETNLAGTGITLGSAVGIAQNQLALRVRFLDPAFLGGPWMTSATLLYNDALDFFGNELVFALPAGAQPGTSSPVFAVLPYKRFGGSLGLGRDLSVSTQLWANYRLESITASPPLTASHIRGTRGEIDREPIDFDILPGQSVLSTLGATLQHDTRDQPVLPTRGWVATIRGEVSLAPLGSQYSYTRFDINATKWWKIRSRHVLGLHLFAGAIAGDAPFFERYYVADLSDFRASRVLGLNVERRPAPNFFDTAIAEVQRGDYAGKVTTEYRYPLYRGSRSVFGIDVFASAGIFAVAGSDDITNPAGGYSGAALIPVDFTANLGFQMDTSAGGFTLAFANALGFIPILNGGQ